MLNATPLASVQSGNEDNDRQHGFFRPRLCRSRSWTAWTQLEVIFLACFWLVAILTESTSAQLPMREIEPEVTQEALLNPGMGLYLQCGGRFQPVPEDAWYRHMANIAYYRPCWVDVEPEEGADLAAYFDPIFDYWVTQRGERVAFRVMAESVSSRDRYVTPQWVFDKGVPSVVHHNGNGDEQIDPVFWTPEYLDQCCRFIERMGACLDGRPGLEFVDIGMIGEWGEMHLGLHIPGRWTSEQIHETGFTHARYVAAYRRIIDAFAAAFSHTRVFLNVGDYREINEYAAIRGIHFRQDGLKPSGPSANVGERFYVPWSRRGVVCNYEFHSSIQAMKEKGWDLHETILKGLEAPISYLNTNIYSVTGLANASEEARRELTLAASRIGFRFVPTHIRYLERFHVAPGRPARVLVNHTWTNRGVAPCYESYALRFSLVDATGKRVAESVCYPTVPTSEWWPGSEVELTSVASFEPDVAPGEYTLKIGMFLPEKPDSEIQLAIEGRGSDGQYALGPITAMAASAEPQEVYAEGFQSEPSKWRPSEGIALAIAPDPDNNRERCLLLTGSQDDAWGFAAVDVPEDIQPGGKYRLTCRMRVHELDARITPSLKLGVADGDGNHLANHNTPPYDTKRPGTWQTLSTVFTVDPQAARGVISLEKGGRTRIGSIRIGLDDVRLELLEGL